NLSGANLSMANLNKANFSRTNLDGAKLFGVDTSEQNLKNVTLSVAALSEANLNKADIILTNLNKDKLDKTNFSKTNLDEDELSKIDTNQSVFNEPTVHDYSLYKSAVCHDSRPIKDAKQFIEILSIWKKQPVTPGIILYTDEDTELSIYIKENFESIDKLTGDWCTIFLLECPPLGWEKSRLYWLDIFENNLHERFQFFNLIRQKRYKKTQAYDIARKIKVDVKKLPCLVLFNPDDLLNENSSLNAYSSVDKLVFHIKEVSTEYFRNLFFVLEEKANDSEFTFRNIKINFPYIMKILDEFSQKKPKDANLASNYHIYNCQFAGGIVNAETVISEQIGGEIYNTHNQ
nr:pentapeptide repeat-containing protein [Nostocaceae cyanobacterium]